MSTLTIITFDYNVYNFQQKYNYLKGASRKCQ